MEKHITEMIRILKEETGLFEKLCSLEKDKTGAIVDHNGKLIEKISLEEEGLLSMISFLESMRLRQVEAYVKQRHIRNDHVTLSDVAATAEKPVSDNMILLGRNLKEVMMRLGRLQETNHVLMHDNMEYYNILLAGLRRTSSTETAYGSNGKEEEKLKNSVLFNQTA
ncbi:MAG TPA: flagellar protein FlgN [Spirochaetota bacterium]|nr:flagellar protein FlgN [Spirochaetota bacterium]HPL19042.1 flagellar protein FlgN [Spirochaetota bacterium]HQJ70261.1 flagellar protein FlgN [Spirochaetota bacterium]HRS78136.1 flagellar protein FlgN [Spirochaetota bacterium]HRT74239.1 flagellar protein FlgN [Spirochaetota bacterium]